MSRFLTYLRRGTFARLSMIYVAALLLVQFSFIATTSHATAATLQMGGSQQSAASGQDGQQGGQQGGQESKDARRIDLGKFVGAATTPVGLIIAGAITISFFEQKRVEACGRVRTLIAELRDGEISRDRRNNIVDQVNIYKSRIAAVHRGSQAVAATIVLFILTNLGSSLGLIWPQIKFFEGLVVCSMLLGMLVLAFSFVMEIFDGARKRDELNTELADFDRVAANPPRAFRDQQPQPTHGD